MKLFGLDTSIGRVLALCGAGLALCVHFSVTLLYLTPLNALKARFLDQVSWYMNPYFSQTWELFGPNPSGRSKTILIACRVEHDGTRSESDWYDITTALMQLHQRDRLSSAQRLLRAENPSYHLFSTEDPVLATVRKLPQDDPVVLAAVRDLEQAQQKDLEIGMRLFARVASGYCDRQFGRDKTSEVRGRVVFTEPPEFRKRNDPNPELAAVPYETPWLKYELVERYH